MIKAKFRAKSNGVPILSKADINAAAESFVEDYQPSALGSPEQFDIEGFLEFYLKMTADYQYLSHNGIYLGMTVFNDTDKVPIYDPVLHRAEYIHAAANTVIIDRRLIEEKNQEHRLRFTQGHEGGHGIWHTEYFHRDPNQLTFLEPETCPIIQCRTDFGNEKRRRTNPKYWTDAESMEWQANAMSSALLMPRPAVIKLFETNGYTGGRCGQIVKTIHDLVIECNVSTEAAVYRMKDLDLIRDQEVPSFMPGSTLLDFAELL